MVENPDPPVGMPMIGGFEAAAAMLDAQSITQIVIAALRNAVGLALGTAMDDGRFDKHAAMILAGGVEVAVGERKFWVNVFEHGDERVQHLAAAAVLAAAEECEAQAVRFEQKMPDGSPIWADPKRSAHVARHCAMYVRALAAGKPYELLERLKKAEADAATLREVSKQYAQVVLVNPDAQNYVEAVMVRHDGAEFVLTIRRREGKTPAELVREAEKRCAERDARWRAAVNGLVMAEPEMRDAIAVLARANDAELSAEGRQAKIWARDLEALLKGE